MTKDNLGQELSKKSLKSITEVIEGVIDANWFIKSWNMSFVNQKMVITFSVPKTLQKVRK